VPKAAKSRKTKKQKKPRIDLHAGLAAGIGVFLTASLLYYSGKPHDNEIIGLLGTNLVLGMEKLFGPVSIILPIFLNIALVKGSITFYRIEEIQRRSVVVCRIGFYSYRRRYVRRFLDRWYRLDFIDDGRWRGCNFRLNRPPTYDYRFRWFRFFLIKHQAVQKG
jgi:hypothetical protein